MPPVRSLASVTRRMFSSGCPRFATSFSRPAPPLLPKKEQELFETLQRTSTGAFGAPDPILVAQPSSQQQQATTGNEPNLVKQADDTQAFALNARVATGEGEELHPDIRRGGPPEFEGDRNPKTGEIGGPKNEPLRWGGDSDWSYNGRVTDF